MPAGFLGFFYDRLTDLGELFANFAEINKFELTEY
jgi:hypothetical protein